MRLLGENSWQCVRMSAQCRAEDRALDTQVSPLRVICHCTTRAMLDMKKYMYACVHVRTQAHGENTLSEHTLCTCMFSYLVLSRTPGPRCSWWGYTVCI